MTASALAVVVVAFVLVGIYFFARHVAAHVHQPPVHPNGRCPICGLAPQETR